MQFPSKKVCADGDRMESLIIHFLFFSTKAALPLCFCKQDISFGKRPTGNLQVHL